MLQRDEIKMRQTIEGDGCEAFCPFKPQTALLPVSTYVLSPRMLFVPASALPAPLTIDLPFSGHKLPPTYHYLVRIVHQVRDHGTGVREPTRLRQTFRFRHHSTTSPACPPYSLGPDHKTSGAGRDRPCSRNLVGATEWPRDHSRACILCRLRQGRKDWQTDVQTAMAARPSTAV